MQGRQNGFLFPRQYFLEFLRLIVSIGFWLSGFSFFLLVFLFLLFEDTLESLQELGFLFAVLLPEELLEEPFLLLLFLLNRTQGCDIHVDSNRTAIVSFPGTHRMCTLPFCFGTIINAFIFCCLHFVTDFVDFTTDKVFHFPCSILDSVDRFTEQTFSCFLRNVAFFVGLLLGTKQTFLDTGHTLRDIIQSTGDTLLDPANDLVTNSLDTRYNDTQEFDCRSKQLLQSSTSKTQQRSENTFLFLRLRFFTNCSTHLPNRSRDARL